MTISAADVPVYTDLAGLGALKRGASSHDPSALRKVAQQFESLFTRMMLKSMRDAVGSDPVFGSDQQQMYQSMADDQLAVQLSHGRGMGIADMLIRQLQRMGVPGATEAGLAEPATAAGSGTNALRPAASTSQYRAVQQGSGSAIPPASVAVQADFVHGLWPQAEQAGAQLGVDPRNLIAQAALETNWGRNLPQDASGRSSHNLFGVKASAGWSGAAITSATQEYQGGSAVSTNAAFRAYASTEQSFQDYVALLRNNPRFSSALNTGSDATAFAAALQRGGYATDPDYVRKVGVIAQSLAPQAAPAPNVKELKSDADLPLTNGTSAPRGP